MLKQPISIVKLTNVTFIKYKIANKNFEIACYPNKVISFRNGIQHNLQSVLQTQEIYQNASHGKIAKNSVLQKFFPDKTKQQIIKIILQKGQLQISDKERDLQLNNTFNDIANFITQKCVDPRTKRPFNVETIKNAIRSVNFVVKSEPMKKQALQCIKLLQKHYIIERAQMKIKIKVEKQNFSEKQLLKLLQIQQPKIQTYKSEPQFIQIIACIQPFKFRNINNLLKNQLKGSVQVLINSIVNKTKGNVVSFNQLDDAYSLLEVLEQQKPDDQKDKTLQKKQEPAKLHCKFCEVTLQNKQQYREHFKSDWHYENILLKGQKKKPISELEYKEKKFAENLNKYK